MTKIKSLKSIIAIVFAIGFLMWLSCAKYEIVIGVSPLGAGDITAIDPDRPLYRRWQKVRVAAAPDAGCSFTGWTGAFESANPDTTFRVKGDMTITANFKRYETVLLGGRLWMVENLNIEVDNSYCYENNPDNCAKWGRLYTWEAAKNACDIFGGYAGWRVPTVEDFIALVEAVGGAEFAGTKLKSATGWNPHERNPVGTDDFGFGALPGGYWRNTINFDAGGYYGIYWSSTMHSSESANAFSVGYYYENVRFGIADAQDAFSVRCVSSVNATPD